jgi:hypothetical protein
LIFDADTEIDNWKKLSFEGMLRADELPQSPFPILMDTYDDDPTNLVSVVRCDGPAVHRRVRVPRGTEKVLSDVRMAIGHVG